MARIFYVHWHEAEAKTHVGALASEGHKVDCHWSTEAPPKIREPYPDALVISLDRLPSHGRHVAEWFWEAKKRRSHPVVFVGGKEDKVAAARAQFPDAVSCSRDELPLALGRLLQAKR